MRPKTLEKDYEVIKKRQWSDEERMLAKNIFECKHLDGLFDPRTRMFRLHEGYNREASYCQFKYLKDFSDESLYYKLLEQEYLYEGLNKSLSIEDAVRRLRRFENIGLICSILIENNFNQFSFVKKKTPQISFFIEKQIYDLRNEHPDVIKAYKDLEVTIRLMGYFVANQNIGHEIGDDGQEYEIVYFTIHPKYIIEVTESIYEKYDGILYHITLERNWKNIQEKGFIPRNSHRYGDDYPDRVYFFIAIPPDNFKLTIKNFSDYAKADYRERLENARNKYYEGEMTKYEYDVLVSHRYDYRNWVVVKVDLKDRRSYNEKDKTTQYRFFDDPRSVNGIFTYENIDPLCLSYSDTVCIDDYRDDFEEFVI